MKNKILYNKHLKNIMKVIFSIFYKKEYLSGYYFDEKRMGWYWAFRSINSRIFGDNKKIPWPVHPNNIVSHPDKIEFDIDNLNIFQVPGCYWQNHKGKIVVGKGSYVAPNVGFITTNHDIYNLNNHVEGKDIIIGEKCWIGMNSVVLPGVKLGNHTIVAAGAIVNKSFENGNCIIGGVPAKVIKLLD